MNSRVISSLFWKLCERFSTQGINFLVTILLARKLTPDDYGVIAIITVFINISTVFIQGGMNTALIQKKDADERDYSCVFFLSLLISFILYIVLFLSAPLIAEFFSMPLLVDSLRVFSLVLFFGAYNSIQTAHLSKKLNFKAIFRSNFIASILSACIGLFLAHHKFGIWALVAQQLSYNIFVFIIMLIYTKWHPVFYFSLDRIRSLFSFGSKILASNLLVSIFLNIRNLIIGKKYDSDALGLYNRGSSFPQAIMDALSGTIQSVMFPAYAEKQDNINLVKDMLRKSMLVSSYVIIPLMVGLIVISKPLVEILLGVQWMDCHIYIQILSISYIFQFIQMVPAQSIKAIGNSSILLNLEILRKSLESVLLLISVSISVPAIAWSAVASGFLSSIFSMIPNKKLLHYDYLEQIKDILPALLLSTIMGILTMFLGNLIPSSPLLKILLQMVCGGMIYVFLSFITRNTAFSYLLAKITKRLKHSEK